MIDALERERLFLAAVHGGDPGPLAAELDPRSAARLAVYRDGFVARLTQTLASTVFERASDLFGASYVAGLVARHLAAHPPVSPIMTEAVATLPATVTERHVRGILELGLARWRVLIGDDPSPTPPPGLTPLHALLLSPAPLYRLWTSAEGTVAAQAEGVLIYKTTPVELAMVLVEAPLFGFASALARGEALENAAEFVEDAAAAGAVGELMQRLVADGAFIP